MNHLMKAFAGILALILLTLPAGTVSAQQILRPIYIISDLHMGAGKAGGWDWNRLEDFRWPRAFDGFLRAIGQSHPKGVDLVIAGDFLELWQHPTASCTRLRDTECGCSTEEMKQIVRDVVAGHQAEFEAIGRFLSNENNRIFVIPGNHDAALMEDEIWLLLAQAVPGGRERFIRVQSGTWFSEDNKVVVEHGHQHAFDANYFPGWPGGVTKICGDGNRFFRTWGENFVQTLYNDVEAKLPLIDNLLPESRGVSIYYQHSKREGTSAADISRFVVFNMLQTSPYQKISAIDVGKEPAALDQDQVDFCRKCIGEDLILRHPEDLDYKTLAGISGSDQEKEFRLLLRQRVQNKDLLDEDALRELCERLALRDSGMLMPNDALKKQPGCDKSLGTVTKMIFDPDGVHVLKKRINELDKDNRALRIYAFGHTHDAKVSMDINTDRGKTIKAYNTGAFLRLMDKNYLKRSKKPGESDLAAFERLTHDDLKPCYPVLAVTYDQANRPRPELRHWYQEETFFPSDGKFLDGCSNECSAQPSNCR